jgi:carbamoylphosphate synthase large subunit
MEQANRFRDKEAMKAALDVAGIRTPRHFAADSIAACHDAVGRIGFPVILKPIAGAGSADTYRVNDADELRAVLPQLQHVPLVSVEEFVDGEEFTYDTITIDGNIACDNIAWYRPRPLIARNIERRYNVATVYKRARGTGHIRRIEGADDLQKRFGRHVVWNTLLPPGSPRRDWKKTLVSDGFVMLRHAELARTLEMADAVGRDLHLYAE